MAVRALARKEALLLLRDRLSTGILLGMPLLFILLLGLLLGEGFGRKTDDRLRVSLVNEDLGYAPRRLAGLLSNTPLLGNTPLGALVCDCTLTTQFRDWSTVVQRDLAETAEIRVELIESRAEAERLIQSGRRSGILIFGPRFTEQVHVCSFISGPTGDPLLRAVSLFAGTPLSGGPLSVAVNQHTLMRGYRDHRVNNRRYPDDQAINPFFRDGVDLARLDATMLKDPTQLTASGIIEQVGQVTLLRVILPWMIGKAFDRMSDPLFIDRLGEEVILPVPGGMQMVMGKEVTLQRMLDMAAGRNRDTAAEFRQKVGDGVKRALQSQFAKYNLTGKTWADLTQSAKYEGSGAEPTYFRDESGSGFLRRGAARYQILVPSYTVMFSFALMLPVGWLFVLERRQGTIKRLRAAPISRGQIVLGKFLPCFAASMLQGLFLLTAGKIVFGMTWGPSSWPWWQQVATLLPVVITTALAAMGLALLLASLARTEIQVALIGGLLVLVLGLFSGCLIPREILPEEMVAASHITPHAWALDAYRQLLVRPDSATELIPNVTIVARSCLVLAGFGLGFMGLSWVLLRLE